jgi:DNA-binding NarL/FixJ family response regulator
MSSRVLIVDDNASMRDTLHRVLGGEPGIEITAEAECGSDALVLAAMQRPDVIVFDLNMPDTRPFHTIRELRTVAPESAVLVFSASDRESDARDAISSGASGFVRKDANVVELVEAVRRVATESRRQLTGTDGP